MNIETSFPLGTVVLLKGGKKRVMIIGFYPVSKGENSKMYDYIGCIYPEGILTSDKHLMFNHNQIEQVFHLGMVSDEDKNFKMKLSKAHMSYKNQQENSLQQNVNPTMNNYQENIQQNTNMVNNYQGSIQQTVNPTMNNQQSIFYGQGNGINTTEM